VGTVAKRINKKAEGNNKMADINITPAGDLGKPADTLTTDWKLNRCGVNTMTEDLFLNCL